MSATIPAVTNLVATGQVNPNGGIPAGGIPISGAQDIFPGRLGNANAQFLALQGPAQAFQQALKLPGVAKTEGKVMPTGNILDLIGDVIGKLTYQPPPGDNSSLGTLSAPLSGGPPPQSSSLGRSGNM